jgi:ParB family chromosome partitioning protein
MSSAQKRSALGKGLGALIEDASHITRNEPVRNPAIDEVNIELIKPNPYQPRTEFDEEALNELADSIRELGIIQPVTLRKIDESKYQIISGERRYRAAKMAGLSAIPLISAPLTTSRCLKWPWLKTFNAKIWMPLKLP